MENPKELYAARVSICKRTEEVDIVTPNGTGSNDTYRGRLGRGATFYALVGKAPAGNRQVLRYGPYYMSAEELIDGNNLRPKVEDDPLPNARESLQVLVDLPPELSNGTKEMLPYRDTGQRQVGPTEEVSLKGIGRQHAPSGVLVHKNIGSILRTT